MERKEKLLILILPTKIIHKNYWSTGPSQSSFRQLTHIFWMGLRLVEVLCMHARRLLQRWSSRTWRAAARAFLDSSGRKPDGKGQHHATGQKHFHKVPQVEFPSSDWWRYHRLPNENLGPGVGSPKVLTGSVEDRNGQIFHISIHGNLTNIGEPMLSFSKVIGQELSHATSADIYLRCRVNFTHNSDRTKIPYFMNLGLLAVHTSDERRSFGTSATRVRRPTDGSNWGAPGRVFSEATVVRESGTSSKKNYSSKTDFETMKENQDFERQNISMSRPLLYSTHFGTNTTNGKTSSIELIHFRTKIPDPTPLTRPTDFPTRPTESSKRKWKVHVLG